MRKKIICLLIAVLMCLASAPLSGFMDLGNKAYALDATGQCGDGAYWNYDSATGELVISGTGEIRDHAFSYTDSYIKKVTIENGITDIGNSAFCFCTELEEVVIPNSVLSIDDYAFRICKKLKSVNIPYSVSFIGDFVFEYCYSLETINVDETNNFYSSDSSGVLFDKNQTLLMQYPIGSEKKSYDIPYGVKAFKERAFEECNNLRNVTIPDSVENIEQYTFYSSENLTNVIIGSNVVKIGDAAFADCERLNNLSIPDSVECIGDSAFVNCKGIISVEIPDGVKVVRSWAFGGCENLTNITLGENLRTIGSNAFVNTAYYNSEDNWENGALYIGEYLIEANDSISDNYVIKEDTVSIGEYAFNEATMLTSITIPVDLVYIGDSAFNNCIGLENVYYEGTEQKWGEILIGEYNDPLMRATIHFLEYECEHIIVEEVVASTCTENGTKVYSCSECGEAVGEIEIIPALGHDFDGAKCSKCGYDRTEGCSCNCHKGGIKGFFFKFVLFFQKIFRTNRECRCGINHY